MLGGSVFDVVLEFQRRQAGAVPVAGKLYLGNILVATGQITRAQLEDALRRQAATGRRLGDELIEAGQARKGQIEGGLLLQRKLLKYALLVAMVLARSATLVPSARAGQTSASMQVSVAVIANTKVRTDYQALPLPNMTHELGYRFVLRPGTQPGSYQWPLLLSVRPL